MNAPPTVNAVRTSSARRRALNRDKVEAAILQVSPGNETHLHGFGTTLIDDAGGAHPYYLHTSPEFAAKKLLAAGELPVRVGISDAAGTEVFTARIAMWVSPRRANG